MPLQRYRMWVLLFFAFLFGGNSLIASHISGMNVSYECLGDNEYLVSINLFRDCYEIQELPTSINVFVYSSCTTIGFEAFSLLTLQEVSQLCDAQLPFSTCNGGSQPGVQLGVYQKILVMDPCSDWRIIVAEQNRDESIANLQNPELTNVHVEALLNNANGGCNSSPALSVVNLPYVCVSSPLFYNLGFVDPDGDSLVYSLVPALASVTPLSPFEMTYTGAYTGEEPIDGITIDPSTGQIEVAPNLLGKFNAVVEVEEYRNGIRIGVVRYDFLFLVNACATPPPEPVLNSFENISGGAYPLSESAIGICANDDFCFTLDFISVDPGVNVELTSNITDIIPGATTTQIGSNPAVMQFCGTIPPGFNGGQFLITALDDACPIYGQAYYAMEFVFRQPLEAFSDMVLCEGEIASISAQNDTLYQWFHPNGDLLEVGTEAFCNPCQTNEIIADTTSWYFVEGLYANSSCANRDSIFIEVPLDMNITVSDETCIGDDGQITIEMLSGSGDYLVEWGDIGVGPLVRTGLVEGPYTVLIHDNVYGCEKELDFEITQMVFPTAYAGEDQEICGFEASLLAVPSSGLAEWTIINGGILSDATIENTTVQVPSQGVYDFVWSENSGGGCLDRDTVRIFFYEMPEVAIAAADTVCGLQANFAGTSLYGDFIWETPAGTAVSDNVSPNVVVESASYGTFEIGLNAQNGVCLESVSHEITFVETPITSVDEDFSVCSDLAEIEGSETVGTGYWDLPSALIPDGIISANSLGLEASQYGLFNVIRKSEHLNFCFDSDTIEVRFVEQPIAVLGPDLVACAGEVSNAFTLPVGNLSWNFSDNLTPIGTVETPTIFQGDYGDHIAVLNADNGYGCIDSDTLNITLIEQPIAPLVLADTICGLATNLTAQGDADLTFWAPLSGVIFEDVSNVQTDLDVAEEGDYIFNWVIENGGICRDTTHYPVTFYNQPEAVAGTDQQVCGLTTNLEASPSFGTIDWTEVPGVNIDLSNDAQTAITADWYGVYAFEIIETNGSCASKDTVLVELISTPEIVNEVWECTGADAMFTLQFDLAYGDSSAHEIAGLEGTVEDFVFTSIELSSETLVQVFLNDQGMCGGDTLSGTMSCPVITSAGALGIDTLWVCTNDMAIANTVVQPETDLNDTLLYVLHTNESNDLSTILSWSDTPEFSFVEDYTYESTYFISAVVGNATSAGVDLSDPYLSVSVGTPVVFKEEPIAFLDGAMTVCPNEAFYIPVDLSGTGQLELTYTVDGFSQMIMSENDVLSIPLESSGLYQLVSIHSDYCEGEASGQMQVDYFPLPTGEIAGPEEICFGDTATLVFTLSGNGPFDFNLLNDGQTVNSYSGIENLAIFETTQGGEFQMVQISDANCHQPDTVSYFLLVKTLPEVDAGADVNFCSGDTVLIGTAAIIGQSYEWNSASGLLDTDTAKVPFTLTSEAPSGEYHELVLTSSMHGCSQSDTVIVTVYGEPFASIEGRNQICKGDSILLLGIGGEASWSPSSLFTDPTSAETYFVGTTDDVIQLAITSPYGCTAITEHSIEVQPIPFKDIGVSQTEGCIPFSAEIHTLFPIPGEVYQWRQNSEIIGQEQNVQMMYTETGAYEISIAITGANGCRVYNVFETSINAYETFAEFEFDDFDLRISNPEVVFNNTSPFNVQSHWTIDSLAEKNVRNLDFTFPNDVGATYEVCLDVIDPNGCTAEFCDEVIIKDEFQVFVPNSFTPNGDGINDVFYPQLLYSDVQEYHFWIIDSKGMVIFESYDANQKWDGQTYYGQTMGENDIYIWHLEVKPDPVLDSRSYTGHVLLLR